MPDAAALPDRKVIQDLKDSPASDPERIERNALGDGARGQRRRIELHDGEADGEMKERPQDL